MKGPPGRLAWLESLHVFGLWAMAVAQPVYQLIAANPQFLAAHAAGRREVLWLIVTLSLLFPAVLASVELLALPLGARARSLVHATVVGLLAATLFFQIAKRLAPGGGWWVPVACIAAAAAFAVAYDRAPPMRSFATFLTIAAVAAPVAFLLDWRILAILRSPVEVDSLAVHVGNPAPVVIVILDELPLVALLNERAEIDAALFPGFARVASRSHWFRNATTTASHTEIAIPSLHTGRHIDDPRSPPATLANYPGNLFTLLGGTYELHALESTTNLLPGSVEAAGGGPAGRASSRLLLLDIAAVGLHVVTPAPFDSRLPSLDAGWDGFWGEIPAPKGELGGRVEQVRAFMKGLEDSPQPPFVYLHPRFPHYPWEYLPSGRRYLGAQYVPGLRMNGLWEHDEWLMLQSYQRLLVQVQAADLMIRDVLDRLEDLGWLDDSVFVLMSDHGVALHPGQARRELEPEQQETLLAEIMPIPLFVKLPGEQEGFLHDEPVEIIDVLPTLGEVLDLKIPWEMDGRSLFSTAGPERKERRLQLQEPAATLRFDRARSAPLQAMARERFGWFGRSPDGHRDLFRIGPNGNLVGSPVPAAPVREPLYAAAILDGDRFDDVDLDATYLPVFVRGELHVETGAPPRQPLAIAIAVNDVVQATTRTYAKPRGGVGFAALLPETALRSGSNTVEVYVVGEEQQLRQVETTAGRRDALREKYDRSRSVLFAADRQTGWSDFHLSREATPDASGGLGLELAGDPLLLELPVFDTAGFDAMLVALDIESPRGLRTRLFYQTEDDPVVRPLRFVPGRVQKGRGVVYFEVRAPDLLGHLSLDLLYASSPQSPGATPRVVVHSLAARGIE